MQERLENIHHEKHLRKHILMNFTDLELNKEIVESLEYMGFTEATPIQEKAIPAILKGKDLIGCAQTGTGKTAAFLLPLFQLILEDKQNGNCSALILAPTRELAVQIDEQIQGLGYFAGISSFPVYGGGGGQEWIQQKKAMKKGADIIVATPGKLLSHLKSKDIDFKGLKYLVLDEADRMLDIGFYEDIMEIIGQLPTRRQNLLFSATMDPKIRKLSSEILHNPVEITIALAKPAEGVLQVAYKVYDNQKVKLIKSLIDDKPKYSSILIFCSTKRKVSEVSRKLKNKNFLVRSISSDLNQDERESVLSGFKARKIRVLVATDVISRGIDIEDINLIINYDLPGDAESYVHRIGRTARAESTGVAISFVNKDDRDALRKIERLIEQKVPIALLPPELGKAPKW